MRSRVLGSIVLAFALVACGGGDGTVAESEATDASPDETVSAEDGTADDGSAGVDAGR